jgi:putative YjhG/YagF family dehydratase
VNRLVPRLVDALPNGPRNHPTVQVFMAGGVPEVMLHLRRLKLLDTSVTTASGGSLDAQLDAWEASDRRTRLRAQLQKEGVNPDDVIVAPEQARNRGLTSTVCFPQGNLAPEGSVIKSTAIDPSVVGADGVYRLTGPAKVFLSERAAMAAIKANQISVGDVLVLIGRGPMGAGMEETYQITSALRHLPFGKHVAVITDARFSGVSTGACVGHISPEALAGGPVGKLRDGDMIEIVVNRTTLEGSINLVGENMAAAGVSEGSRILVARQPRPDLAPDPSLPDDTRIWAALQDVSGGTWGGAVYDPEAILRTLAAGKRALGGTE